MDDIGYGYIMDYNNKWIIMTNVLKPRKEPCCIVPETTFQISSLQPINQYTISYCILKNY